MNTQAAPSAYEIYQAAIQLPASERDTFVRSRAAGRPEVEAKALSFLRSYETNPPLVESAIEVGPADAVVGRMFDGYRVIRQVARGGMGAVYEAEEVTSGRLIAMKLIRPHLSSPEVHRRFEQEYRILSKLEHEGIARVYLSGRVDLGWGEQPYIIMELIRGTTLDKFIAQKNPSLRDRLRVIAAVAEAVHAAHQKAIHHRDLKPANIMLDEAGKPKVLDFGVARLADGTGSQTIIEADARQLIGTPDYMSPEQAKGDTDSVDALSDVYSLGVVLYETLTGELPHEVRGKSATAAAQVILNQNFRPIDGWPTRVPGDVATIVHKALSRDRAQRYQSALELRADLERYLNDEPIAARPPSTIYEFRKFAQRNRVVVGGVGATLLAVLAGLAVSIVLLERVRQAKDLAESRRWKTYEAIEALVGGVDFAAASEVVGNRLDHAELITLADALVLSPAVQMLDRLDPPDAEISSSVLTQVANVYRDHGWFTQAEARLKQTLEVRLAESPRHDGDVAAAQANLGYFYLLQERYDEAAPLVRNGVAGLRVQTDPKWAPELAGAMDSLARIEAGLGNLDAAMAHFDEAIARHARLAGDDSIPVVIHQNNAALCLAAAGKLDDAERRVELAQAMIERLGDRFPSVIRAGVQTTTGKILTLRGRLDDAERELIAARRVLLAEDAPYHAVRRNLAALADVERLRTARPGDATSPDSWSEALRKLDAVRATN